METHRFTDGELELLLAHEVAHVIRRDFAWHCAQVAAETLCVFHPAIRWLGRCTSLERECATDNLVTAAYGNPREYAAALSSLAGSATRSRLKLAAGQHSLVARVERLVGAKREARPITRLGSVSCGVGLLLVLLQPDAVGEALVTHVGVARSEVLTGVSLHEHRNQRFRHSALAVHRDQRGARVYDLRLGSPVSGLRFIGIESPGGQRVVLVEELKWHGSQVALLDSGPGASATRHGELLSLFEREAGIRTAAQLDVLRARVGLTGLLTEIGQTGTEWARGRLLNTMLASTVSDEERAVLLDRVASLSDAATKGELFVGELRRATGPEDIVRVLAYAARLDSDAELERVVRSALKVGGTMPEVRAAATALLPLVKSEEARAAVQGAIRQSDR